MTRRAGALCKESSASRIVSVRLLGRMGKLLMTVRQLAHNIETSGRSRHLITTSGTLQSRLPGYTQTVTDLCVRVAE